MPAYNGEPYLAGEPASVLFRRSAAAAASSFNGERPFVIDMDMEMEDLRRSGLYPLSAMDIGVGRAAASLNAVGRMLFNRLAIREA